MHYKKNISLCKSEMAKSIQCTPLSSQAFCVVNQCYYSHLNMGGKGKKREIWLKPKSESMQGLETKLQRDTCSLHTSSWRKQGWMLVGLTFFIAVVKEKKFRARSRRWGWEERVQSSFSKWLRFTSSIQLWVKWSLRDY